METKNYSEKDSFNASVVLPSEEAHGSKIWFTCRCCGSVIEGIWVAGENLFFIGFEDKGNFLHRDEVGVWGYLPETTEDKS